MKNLSQILLFFTVATMLVSCNNSTTSPESVAQYSEGSEEGCSVGMRHSFDDAKEKTLRAACKTIFVIDTLIVYKDTVYDDSVITAHSYTSFVYLNRYTGNTDTLLERRAEKYNESGPCGDVPVFCNLDSSSTEKTFKCEMSNICYMYEVAATQVALPNEKFHDVVLTPYNYALCQRAGFKCVTDTVYLDAYHTTLRKDIYDTLFLNYGANAWTNYIPAVNAPPFDTAAFRNAFDTLDTQNEIFGMDTLFTGYNITMEGLPDWVIDGSKIGTICDVDGVCTTMIWTRYEAEHFVISYPTSYSEKQFFLKNMLENPLEKDTLITWTLKYNYGVGQGDNDSLTIQTLFKGIGP